MAHRRSYSEGAGASQGRPPTRGSLSAEGAHPAVLHKPPTRRGSVVGEAARLGYFEPSFVDVQPGGDELAKSPQPGGRVDQRGRPHKDVCLLPPTKLLPFNC